MKRSCILIGITLLLFALGILGLLHGKRRGQWVVILQNNIEIQRVALAEVTEPRIICVAGKNGEENCICITPEEVYMESANCPDGICMHMGNIIDSDAPIICLPNGVVVRILQEELP